jgi:hypothetical protein
MTLRRMVYGCTALALTAGVALAQEPGVEKKKGGKPDEAAMMAAYEKAGQPGEQHRLLQRHVGKWNVNVKMWMAPTAPPMESKGTAETTSLFGDRYVQTAVKIDDMMGKPFSGLGTTGYDNTRKKFVGSWIDSTSTGMMLTEGTADPAGKVFTTQALSTDPLTGKQTKTRMVAKWEGDDKIVEEFFDKKGGKDVKTMEITYTRAK